MLTVLMHKKSKRTRMVLIGISAAVLLAGASITLALWPKDPAKIVAELGNDPRKVWEAVEQGKLSREDAFDAMRARFEADANKRMDEFFALPAGKPRDQYLDKMIDEMQARRREWEQRRATTAPTTRPAEGRRGDGPATRPSDAERQRRMAMRDDNTPPARRAQRAEFMAAMMKRMQERGIQMGGPGGGRGMWGGGMRGGGGGRDGGGRGGR